MTSPHRLHHTSLTVSDVKRSVAFYERVVGMHVVMTQEKRGGYLAKITGYPDAHVRMAQLCLDDGQYRLELFEYVSPAGSPSRTPAPADVGITHVCFEVEDIHTVYRRALEMGAHGYSEPVEIESGANQGGFGVYLHDPDGITIELFQPPAG